jgi:tetratricopeptide (TPR) repeat protein
MIGVLLNNTGFAYQSKSLYDQAISDYNRALEIDLRYVRAYFNMALAYDQIGRIKEAIEAYRGFIQYAPGGYQMQIEHATKRIKELEK